MERTFTLIDFPVKGKYYGKYQGKNPSDAAKKIFNFLSKKINLKNTDNKNLMYFAIKDLKNDKIYRFIGMRVQLYQPIKIKIGNKIIEYKYKNVITKYENLFK